MSIDEYKKATAALLQADVASFDYINDAEIRMVTMGMFEALDSDVDGLRDDGNWGVYCNSVVVEPDPEGAIHYRRGPKNSPNRGSGSERYTVQREEVTRVRRVENPNGDRPQYILSNYEV